jgi:hypothetical protein
MWARACRRCAKRGRLVLQVFGTLQRFITQQQVLVMADLFFFEHAPQWSPSTPSSSTKRRPSTLSVSWPM